MKLDFRDLFQHNDLKSVFSMRSCIIYIVITSVFVILATLQDFINSRVHGSSFFLSESIIYKAIWILLFGFLPVFYVIIIKSNFKQWYYRLFWIPPFSLIHVIIASYGVYILSVISLDHFYTPDRVFDYYISNEFFPLILVYFLFIFFTKDNFLHLFYKKVRSEESIQYIPVTHGKEKILIRTSNILYITTDRPYLAVVTMDGRELITSSLKELLNKLDKRYFVRIHKSTIVNVNYIRGMSSRSNGDYDLKMSNDKGVRLSRNYSKEIFSLIQNHDSAKY